MKKDIVAALQIAVNLLTSEGYRKGNNPLMRKICDGLEKAKKLKTKTRPKPKGKADEHKNPAQTELFGLGFVTAMSAAAAEGANSGPIISALVNWGFRPGEIRALPMVDFDREHLAEVVEEMEARQW